MPAYEFECGKCRRITERFFKAAEKPDSVECVCGGSARKILSAPMVLGDDMPAWMRHPETLGCLQSKGEKPIETRSEYNRYLKKRNIAEISANSAG